MKDFRVWFTRWYYRMGYKMTPLCCDYADGVFKLVFCCPWWIRILAGIFCNPEVYFQEAVRHRVDHISGYKTICVRSPEEFAERVGTEISAGNVVLCPECHAVFEDDDIAYTHETGLCQYCHSTVRSVRISR